jgi:hypothetical protein
MNILPNVEKKLLIPAIPFIATSLVAMIKFDSLSVTMLILLSLFIFVGYLYTKIPQNARHWRTAENEAFEPVKRMILVLRSFVVSALIILPISILALEITPVHIKSSVNNTIKDKEFIDKVKKFVEEKGEIVLDVDKNGTKLHLKISVINQNGVQKPVIELTPMIHIKKDQKSYYVETTEAFNYFENHVIKPAITLAGCIVFILTLLSVIMICYAEIMGHMQRNLSQDNKDQLRN